MCLPDFTATCKEACAREVRIVVDGEDGLGLEILRQKIYEQEKPEILGYSDDYRVELDIEVERLTCEQLAEAMVILNKVQLKIYKMTLRDCDLKSGDISTFMAACRNMHTLIIISCKGLAVSAMGAGPAPLSLEGCKSLHTIHLSWNRELTDVAALGLGQCASLRTLNLKGCTSLANVVGLAALGSLRTLILSHCLGLTDVAALAASGRLRTLYVVCTADCGSLLNISVPTLCHF